MGRSFVATQRTRKGIGRAPYVSREQIEIAKCPRERNERPQGSTPEAGVSPVMAHFGQQSKKRMLKKYVRSRNVYENTQISDTIPGKKSDIYVLDSDIYVYPNAILQKIAALRRQFVRSIRFFAGFFVHYKAHLRIMSPHNLRCSAGFQPASASRLRADW